MKTTCKLSLCILVALAVTACGAQQGDSSINSGEEIHADGEIRLPDDPNVEAATEEVDDGGRAEALATAFKTPNYTSSQKASILARYSHLDPTGMINEGLLAKAVLYYHANLNNIAKKSVLTVIDFSLSSKYKRMFIIDMATGAVTPSHTSHGKGSDANHDGYAEKFSNVSGSNASSLGPYLTAETYYGSNGYSLRIDGLASTNSRARARAVVVHGASYVQDRNVIQGRSYGCPAVPNATRTAIINRIKGGSLMYAGLSHSLSSTP